MMKRVIDEVVYIDPLQPFKGTLADKELLTKWKEHYIRLGIDTLQVPFKDAKGNWDGRTVELLVNKEQNDRSWNSLCLVGDRYIGPPHPRFGINDYKNEGV